MSEFTDAKQHFYIDAVVHGITAPKDFRKVYPLGCAVPVEKMERWLQKFREPLQLTGVPTEPRLINHFMLGADPEFVFVNDGGGVHASTLGLRTGLFAGADLNGRLVEVRPSASRFALDVVGSVLDSLRFLARLYPNTLLYEWQAGAYKFHDGLGGHVHFGRKRLRKKLRQFVEARANHGTVGVPEELSEVQRLDRMMAAMLSMKCYPLRECKLRASQAQGGHYGQPGDVRLQVHGYEYRTFPSWLDNPWLAYLTLVVSKLIVQDPDLYRSGFEASEKASKVPEQIYNLLCYYKGRDDDAAIALMAYKKHGWPRHGGGDFKARWGVSPDLWPLKVDIFPSYVKPAAKTATELFDYLTKGVGIPVTNNDPTWNYTLPKGYELMIHKVETAHAHGMGELLADLCTATSMPLNVMAADAGEMLCVSGDLRKKLPTDWQKKVQAVVPEATFRLDAEGRGASIRVGRRWREQADRIVTVRRALLCGVFPVWSSAKVTEQSLEEWKKNIPTKNAQPKRGVVLFNSDAAQAAGRI